MADPYSQVATTRPSGPVEAFQSVPVVPRAAPGRATAEGLETLGRGGVRAAEVFDQIAAEDLSNQYQDFATKLLYGDPNKQTVGADGKAIPDLGYFGKKGRAALDDRPNVERQLEEKQRELGGGKSGAGRREFNKFADSYRLAARGRISNYADAQTNAYGIEVNNATAKTVLSTVGINPTDGDTVEHAREDLKSAYVKNAELKGGGPELINEAIRQADADILKAQVQSIATTNPMAALALLERKKKDAGILYPALYASLKPEANSAEADAVVAGYVTPTAIPDAVKTYDPLIQKAAADVGISPALGYGLIAQESGGNPHAVSSAGATGLTQLMAGTAKDLGVTDRRVPEQAVPAGFKYLKQQIDKYGSERAGLMAYNWGPGNYESWVKAGADPEKVPFETRDFVRKVQGYAASFGNRMDVKAAQLDIMNRPDLSVAVKTSAITKLEKQSSAVEAIRTAQVKTLNDTLEATTQAMILAPTLYKKGTLAQIAAGYEAAGDQSAAVNTRVLANAEDLLLTFTTSSENAQKRILEGLLPGKAKALASGILAADKEAQGEALKTAHAEFNAIKEAVEKSRIPIGSMTKKIGDAIEMAVKSRDPLLPRQIYEYAESRAKAESVGQATPTQQERAIADLREKVEKGAQTNSEIAQLDFAEQIAARQKEAFAKDAFAAGTQTYAEVGRPGTINWGDPPEKLAESFARRVEQATRIGELRDGIKVLPFSQPEITQLRNYLAGGGVDKSVSLLRMLSTLPPQAIEGVGAALAGKDGAGDHVSRSFAAAMGLYSEKDPKSAPVADKIVRGVSIIKNLGDSGKKAPVLDDAWQTTLQDTIKNTFFGMFDAVPAMVSDAIAAVYTYNMHQAGRQGEKAADTTMLRTAITDVLGTPLRKNGQSFLPPERGMDDYGFDKALRTLRDSDLPQGMKTLEGDPVTAQNIIDFGIFRNVRDSTYQVLIEDPRRNGAPSPMIDPSTGKSFILDMRPYITRSREDAKRNLENTNRPDYVVPPTPLGGRRP